MQMANSRRFMQYCLYHEKYELESILCAMLVTLTVCVLCTGAFAAKYTCIKSGCNREAAKGSAYCWVHRPSKSSTKSSTSYSSKSSYSSSYSSSKKSYKTYDSYDDGYDAIYDDDDYDEDRYDSDPDYAAGVDDAMDELDCYIN